MTNPTRKTNRNTTITALCLAAIMGGTLSTGCASFGSILKDGLTRIGKGKTRRKVPRSAQGRMTEEYHAAKEAQDIGKLSAMCKEKNPNLSTGDACFAIVTILKEKKDNDGLLAICMGRDSASAPRDSRACSAMGDAYLAAFKSAASTCKKFDAALDPFWSRAPSDTAFVVAVAEKAASCGKWDIVFKRISLSKRSHTAFNALQKKGHDVSGEFAKFVRTSGPRVFSARHMDRASWNITNWLALNNKTQNCSVFASRLPRASVKAKTCWWESGSWSCGYRLGWRRKTA